MAEPAPAPAPAPSPAPAPNPAPNPAPAPAAWTATQENWREALIPAEYKDDSTLKDIKTPQDMVKSYVEGQRMIGQKRVAVPGADAKPEEIDAYHKAIGRPDKPDGYDFTKVKPPENVKVNEAALTGFKDAAHKLGLTPTQASSLYELSLQMGSKALAENMAAVKAQRDAGIETLRQEWGGDFDTNIAHANAALRQHFPKEFIDFLKTSGMGNDSAIIRGLHAVGKRMAEGGMGPKGAMGPSGFSGSRNEAQLIIEQINKRYGDYKDFRNEMSDNSDPVRRAARVKTWQDLNAAAAAEKNNAAAQ